MLERHVTDLERREDCRQVLVRQRRADGGVLLGREVGHALGVGDYAGMHRGRSALLRLRGSVVVRVSGYVADRDSLCQCCSEPEADPVWSYIPAPPALRTSRSASASTTAHQRGSSRNRIYQQSRHCALSAAALVVGPALRNGTSRPAGLGWNLAFCGAPRRDVDVLRNAGKC